MRVGNFVRAELTLASRLRSGCVECALGFGGRVRSCGHTSTSLSECCCLDHVSSRVYGMFVCRLAMDSQSCLLRGRAAHVALSGWAVGTPTECT